MRPAGQKISNAGNEVSPGKFQTAKQLMTSA